jgi:hypothetical protein
MTDAIWLEDLVHIAERMNWDQLNEIPCWAGRVGDVSSRQINLSGQDAPT